VLVYEADRRVFRGTTELVSCAGDCDGENVDSFTAEAVGNTLTFTYPDGNTNVFTR
jgi:hypothetical protein